MARSARGLVLPGLLTLVALAVLISLGNWQVRRLAWKEALIASATERPQMPVVDLPAVSEWPDLATADLEYRPFRMTGRFLFDREALVFTSLSDARGEYSGPGSWVVTPFALEGGGTVLVNRGFVPDGWKAPTRRDGVPLEEGTVTATGLLRPDEMPNMFTPDDRPEENQFFARNVAAIAQAKGLGGPVAPFTIDLLASETPPGGLPQAGETRFAFTNNHIGYAVTWYGLAAALAAVFGAFAWSRLRGRDTGPRLTPPGTHP
jgi:surfeit locus 1 family protein